MRKDQIISKVLKKFNPSKSRESRREGPSDGDIYAAQFMRKFEEDQRKQAKRNWGIVFEG